jgi:hypothetical protein
MRRIVYLAVLLCVAGCAGQASDQPSSPQTASPSLAGAWRSVVISLRDPESGMCSLAASGFLRKTARSFRFNSLWKYDPEQKRWSQVKKNLHHSTQILPLDKKDIISPTDHQVLIDLTDEIGLFWAWFEEDGRKTGILVYSGDILPNDLMIGPDKAGFIRVGIPYADHATAAYVPDPKIHCK